MSTPQDRVVRGTSVVLIAAAPGTSVPDTDLHLAFLINADLKPKAPFLVTLTLSVSSDRFFDSGSSQPLPGL